jgi:hypothetical protein
MTLPLRPDGAKPRNQRLSQADSLDDLPKTAGRSTTVGAGHSIEPLLSIDDLAVILHCSRRLVERMRSAGKLPPPDLLVGRMPRWKPETIRQWIEQGGAPWNGR